MNFRFNIDKATEASAAFIEKAGGRINVLKLVKLMYLLDRLALDSSGAPVSGGTYFSMKDGPMTSEILDLINYDYWGVDSANGSWSSHIGERQDHQVELKAETGRQHLSDLEIEMIDAIWEEHGLKDEWTLVDWCHRNCGEWTKIDSGRAEITVERVCENLGKKPQQIERLRSEMAASNRLDELFAS